MASPIDLLRQACSANLTSASSLSDDGEILTLLGSSFDATAPHNITVSDSKGGSKEVSYSLASIYLQLLNSSVLQYRKACEAGGVQDPVKVLDKGGITDFFFGRGDEDDGAESAEAAAAAGEDGKKADDPINMSDGDYAVAADDSRKESVQFSQLEDKRARGDKDRHRSAPRGGRDKDRSGGGRHRHRSHSKSRKEDEDRDERSKSGGKGAKGAVVPITNEQLVANLSTIVDKRDQTKSTPTKEKAQANIKKNRNEAEDKEGTATPPPEDDAMMIPADSRQVMPAATSASADDDGRGPSKEDAEKKEKEDRELLLSWLSPEGFQVDSPAVSAAIEADRDAVRQIAALEIPVGDSASILRAGAGGEVAELRPGGATEAGVIPPLRGGGGGKGAGAAARKRDFARTLEIYQDVVGAEERARRSSSSGGLGGRKRPPPPPPMRGGKVTRTSDASSPAMGKSPGRPGRGGGNPIIVVPNAMTSAITMINAGFFLGKDAVFIPRARAQQNPAAGKRGGTTTITRRLHQRLGGVGVTYDIIDNPTTRLRKDEWDRVVAVICQGASWQFKGWRYSDPVDLFSRTFGFYVGLEGAAVPGELRGWNVKIGKVSRDRRGLDNVCLASFWNGLEEFMAVHKQELFKS